MTTCPTFYGVNNKDMEGIAKALRNLYKHNVKEWNRDNLVSVLEELMGKLVSEIMVDNREQNFRGKRH